MTVTDARQASDPILDELHAVRRRMHDECGGDLSELVARMRSRQANSGHPMASIPVTGHRTARESTAADQAEGKQPRP